MSTVTNSLIEVFRNGVALTPKEAFYILQSKGIRTTYKSVSKILSRLYYRGTLERAGGKYIFSSQGRQVVSSKATHGDNLKVEGDSQKMQYISRFSSRYVSNTVKLKRNGIRSKLMKRFLAILMNNNIEFFDSNKFYQSLQSKYCFHLNRSTYRVILHRLKLRGFLSFRFKRYYVNMNKVREFFSVSDFEIGGASTHSIPKNGENYKFSKYKGTQPSVSEILSVRVSEHAPRVDIKISKFRKEIIEEKYNLKVINPRDPSGKMRFKGKHINAIITKNGYVMIIPKDSQWLEEVREVFGEEAAASAKLKGAMKHKEYALGDLVKLYKSERFGARIDYSEFNGDIGFQGDAEKVEVADEIFRQEIMSKVSQSAYLADIIVDLDRTSEELKELLKNTREEVMAQVLLNSQAVSVIRESAREISNVMRQFIDILKNAQNGMFSGGEVEGYA